MFSTNSNENDWKTIVFETQQKRLENLLLTGQASDIKFLVGNKATGKELFKAHTFVLGIGSIKSEKFEGQFRTNESTKWPKDKPIEVTDIKPSAFEAILHYLYLGDLSKINRENIADVLDAAKKYLLPELAQKCVHLAMMTSTILDVHNVLYVQKMAKLHEEEILIDHCALFIDKNIANFLETEQLLALNQMEIEELFARDTLDNEHELALFRALDRWAQKQCQDQNIEEPTGEQKRAAMGSALNAIRLPLISAEDFNQQIASTNILNAEELAAMSLYYNSGNINAQQQMKAHHSMPFSNKMRLNPRNNKWDSGNCGSDLTISEEGLEVKHSGKYLEGTNCVRAAFPIPKLNLSDKSIAYFEVEIVKYNQFWHAIHIGFCTQQFSLQSKYLGFEENSIGIWFKPCIYIDNQSTKLENEGGYFQVGDIVGMGIIQTVANSQMPKCFVSCNGELLGMVDLPTKFKDLQLFPAITLLAIGDTIRANFGQNEWRFNFGKLR